jgi:hypothetical protein
MGIEETPKDAIDVNEEDKKEKEKMDRVSFLMGRLIKLNVANLEYRKKIKQNEQEAYDAEQELAALQADNWNKR